MTASDANQNKLGLVLTAGGARAAYQVGSLRYLAKHIPNFSPSIFTGISAGSINAAFLAQGKPIEEATETMFELWKTLEFEEVMNTNFRSFLGMFNRLLNDLFISKFTKRKLFNSILDATPLAVKLSKNIQFPKIAKSIESGIVQGLAVSTTNYNTGNNTIFFDSHEDVAPWRRKRRTSVRSPIRIKHIMASCSIPILFEPVRIGDAFYGDGAIRFRYPLSAAIHLGASKLLAIGISPDDSAATPRVPKVHDRLSTGLVAGVVLNSIFVDSLDTDLEYAYRLNEFAKDHPEIRPLEVCLLRPSQDLGSLAEPFINELPYHFRQFLKASAGTTAELGDLMSYLMFGKGYIQALMELGEKDAKAQHDRIESFINQSSPQFVQGSAG